MNFLELCKKRYASRDFDRNRQIEKEKLDALLKAAQLAPTGRNAQQFKVFVLQSSEALEKAEKCTPCTYNAPTVLVVTYDNSHPESHLDVNDVNVGLVNATIVATFIMIEAEEQGLGSCYVELFDGSVTKTELGLKDGWEPACFLPIGYSTAGPGPRHFVRKTVEEISKTI